MGTPRRTRLINSSRIIHRLWIEDELSRADLASRLGLNRSSVSNIVADLMQRGIVRENKIIDPGPKGGRRAIGITLNTEYFNVIGIEIRSDSYTALSIDLEGSVLFSETQPKGFNAKTFTHEVRSLIDTLTKRPEYMGRHLLGVGIGFSGIVDTERQMIIRSVSFDFMHPFDFYGEIACAYSFPVFLENDANCGAWGEVIFQRKRNLRNFLFVLIEFWKAYDTQTGLSKPTVGLGFGFDGKIYRGSNNRAGEFKSVLNRDVNSSEQVVVDNQISITEDTEALHEYLREVCDNLAFLINTLDIANVFIGGNVETIEDVIPDMLRRALRANSLDNSDERTHIQFSSLGYQAVSFGSAALVLDKVLMNLEPLSDNASQEALPLFHLLA